MPDLDLSSLPARRGVYSAERASQLSGVPKSTVYYWARESKLLVPSVSNKRVKLWSYRDLVFLRFVAWLRTNGARPPTVRAVLDTVRDVSIDLHIRSAGARVFSSTDNPDAIVDVLTNQLALAGEIAAMLPEFHLDASEMNELGRRRLWGPHLIRPTENTRIHPDVLSGDPFVHRSRIPTTALYALTERGLSAERIAELYELELDVTKEALWLESSVRAGRKLPLAA
jgi:DNA-binding transcriptional MerR regulator/uncharacterized protein (DUF433 family)